MRGLLPSVNQEGAGQGRAGQGGRALGRRGGFGAGGLVKVRGWTTEDGRHRVAGGDVRVSGHQLSQRIPVWGCGQGGHLPLCPLGP